MKRFWDKVDIKGPEECWIWKASVKSNRYGQFRFNKKNTGAHRVAYILTHGEFDNNLDVCHTCDNPPCVNPNHLWLGTTRDNILDMTKKGRHGQQRLSRDNCRQGHPYTEETTGYKENGNKYCKICKCLRAMRYYDTYKSKKVRIKKSKYAEYSLLNQ